MILQKIHARVSPDLSIASTRAEASLAAVHQTWQEHLGSTTDVPLLMSSSASQLCEKQV